MDSTLSQLQALKSDLKKLSPESSQTRDFSLRLESLEKAFKRTASQAERALKDKLSFQSLVAQLSKDLSEKIQESESHAEQLNEALSQLRLKSKELEERNELLKIAEAKALDASLAKSQFLAKMTHELRTPMNGFLGMLQLLEMTELTEEQRHFIDTMRSAGGSLMNLIEPILDFSKIEAGKLELECRSFDLQKDLKEMVDLFLPISQKSEINLKFDYDESAPKIIVGDKFRLRQIMSNLLSNALKFGVGGNVIVSVKRIGETGSKARLHFEVKDEGIGIPSNHFKTLFESFNQVDNSSTRAHGGTGLGLAVSQDLVKLMGGSIGLESEVGKGSRFFFDLEFPLDESK